MSFPPAQHFQSFVSSVTLERAKALLRHNKVLTCAWAPQGPELEISGRVQGTASQPYTVNAAVVFNDHGKLHRFASICSCPVGVDCKHGVALTLRALEESAGTTASPPGSVQEQARLQSWLRELDKLELRVQASMQHEAGEGQEQNIFMLNSAPAEHGKPPGLLLSWLVSKKNKRGGWNKPQKPSFLREYDLDRADPGMPSLDVECIRLLIGLRKRAYNSGDAVPVQGDAGRFLLEQCAATGRLFWGAEHMRAALTGPPLQWVEPRQLQWEWRAASPGRGASSVQGSSWQLQPVLQGAPQALVFPGPPVVYLLPEDGGCGLVELPEGITPAHLPVLMAAPPIPERVFHDEGSPLLQRLAPLRSLPPGIQAPEAWSPCTPRSILKLGPVLPPDNQHKGPVQAQLEFDYAGLRGWWAGKAERVRVSHQDRPVLLTRDRLTEESAHQRLWQLGLQGGMHGTYINPKASVWLDWAAQDWQPLRDAGFDLELDPGLEHLVQTVDTLDVRLHQETDVNAEGDSPWFDLSLGIDINGQRHNVLPWLPAWLDQVEEGPEGPHLPQWLWQEQADGRWLRLPSAPLQPWLRALLELVGERKLDSESLRLSNIEALRLAADMQLLGDDAVWQGAGQLRSLLGQLTGGGALPQVPLPAGLQAQLRPYQHQGLNWLQFLRQNQLGGVLADDMGLGKTLQTLAHLLVEHEAGRLDRPCLVIAPVSLLGNWRREAERFAPTLRTRVWHGQNRHEGGFTEECDLLIAPYSLLLRDRERWLSQKWHVLVLDEAQHIKNASSQVAQVVRELDARQRIALSGTPLENHLGELWSLFHFLMPGFLGSQARFQKVFRTPIEKQGDTDALARLRQRVTPFMLRRTKAAVASELPDCVETIVSVRLEGAQADLYETIRLATEKTVRDALAAKGLARSQIQLLDALLKLRQACCDPRLVKNNSQAAKIKTSAKLAQLMDMLEELLAEGRKVLLFSQFTSMLALIETELQQRGMHWTKLTGQTQKRDEAIARFTAGQVPLFLISLKAGGTGLNLPQADTVIHFDPWWNPAVEAQATGRAHRIGQTRQVMVYKLVAEGTIEERILALQARKAALAEGLLTGAAGRDQPLFTEDDVAELLRPLGG